MVTIKFFASLREQVGRGDLRIAQKDGQTVLDAWRQACPGMPLTDGIMAAVNHDYVERDHVIKDGDEVAFFPPVTGG
ncbi:MAG: molybdopterin converting factor subunit 1 [Chromatiales bacterium]|jgi:sulfur-carrier protein|nr:molybdopterin converting factor subunit 1 [Chromatiales bacterium]